MRSPTFVSLSFALASVMALAQYATISAQEKQEQQARAAGATKTVTGCLRKGSEPGEFFITGEGGQTWSLRSSAVKLEKHLGHKVTVSGPITHEPQVSEMTQEEKMEKPTDKEEYGSLRVTRLKMLSKTCSKL